MNSNENNVKKMVNTYMIIMFSIIMLGSIPIIKASLVMFTERNYWQEVAKRYKSEEQDKPGKRGVIFSSDGELMASSIPEYILFMDFMTNRRKDESPKEKEKNDKLQAQRDSILNANMDSICLGLHKILPDKSVSYFKKTLKAGRKNKSRDWQIYPKRVTYLQYKEIRKIPFFSRGRYKSGLKAKEYNKRKKAFGSLAARTLGDVYGDKQKGAKNGLELAYDSILRGKPGKYHYERVRRVNVKQFDVRPIDGYDIVTTLDTKKQDIAETALIKQLKEMNAEYGTAVLMEVKTGDIKAMVNMNRNSDGTYSETESHAISDYREPGSVFKTASLMVALEDGKITPEMTIEVGKDAVWPMHGKKMTDDHKTPGGVLTVEGALAQSSNIAVSRLIDNAYNNNPKAFVEGIYRTGLATPLNIELPGAIKCPNIRMPNKKTWYKTTLAWMAIGYETQIPPISTLTFYNAIANNGVLVKPRFVTTFMKNGKSIETKPIEILNKQIASPKTLQQIQKMLRMVVTEGTARKIMADMSFEVSGKTGTAQVSYKGNYGSAHFVSFCGYFPSDNPKYSCIVCIFKDGNAYGWQSGIVFRDIAEHIMAQEKYNELDEATDTLYEHSPKIQKGDLVATDYVLTHLGNNLQKKKSWNEEENQPRWGSAMIEDQELNMQNSPINAKQVPNVTGMGARDAVYLLESMGLKVQISGQGSVCSQSIPFGQTLVKGSTIGIKLE